MRPIDADALLEYFKDPEGEFIYDVIVIERSVIDNMPTLDVEVKEVEDV